MRNYTNQDLTKLGPRISGREFQARKGEGIERGIKNFDVSKMLSLKEMGILFDESERNTKRTIDILKSKDFNRNAFEDQMHAFDALEPTVLPGSVSVPVQFLQYWMPGTVQVLTSPRVADEFMGYRQAGLWESEQVIIQNLEMTGSPTTYLDGTRNPLASYQNGFTVRNIIRFQQGLKVSELEARRASAMQLDDAGTKRQSCAYNLDIIRNSVSWVGFNAGANNTYGFLNAPELSAYTQVAAGVGGRPWSVKDTVEICDDILTARANLIETSNGYVNENTPCTLALPTNTYIWLTQTTVYGFTVMEWLEKTFKNLRIVNAVQLQDAYSSSNVFYLYADNVQDGYSTDGGDVWYNGGPTKFMMLGVQQLTDGFEERYTNATYGAICPRPWAVVRYYGI